MAQVFAAITFAGQTFGMNALAGRINLPAMAAETEIIIDDDFARATPEQRVYTKTTWSGQWQLHPFLWCDWAIEAAAPQISSAQIRWRYGYGMQPGQVNFSQHTKAVLIGRYVKIQIDGVPTESTPNPGVVTWYGIVSQEINSPSGSLLVSGNDIAAGDQVFRCQGMEVLLARTRVSTSQIETVNQLAPNTLSRAVEFNGSKNSADSGNRSVARGPNRTYVFARTSASSRLWSAADIVRYLLEWHSPTDRFGNERIPFSLAAGAKSIITDLDQSRVPQHGRTVKEILDSVLDRRRLISYFVAVENDFNVVIKPFRFNAAPIVLDNSILLPNANTLSLVISGSADIEDVSFRFEDGQRYDEIVVRGDRITSSYTISALDGTLAKHWDAALETAYNDGASGEGDYPVVAQRDDRKRRNKDFRASDQLARVYSHFGLLDTWNGLVKDGEAGASNPYLPSTDPVYFPELRFLPKLPLKSDHDYSASLIGSNAVVNNTPAGKQWEYLRPIVLLKLNDPGDTSGVTRYAHVDELAANADTPGTGDGAGRKWSCSFRMQDASPGIVLKVHGAPQHAIATVDFVAPDDSDDDVTGTIDWNDNLLATVAMKADVHVSARYPAGLPATDTIRRLEVDMGDTAQLHYVAPGTVVGINDGKLVRTTSGGYVRNDSLKLARLARVAYEWYSAVRQAFSLSVNQLITYVYIGDLLTTVQQDPLIEVINTPITEIKWEMPISDGEQASNFRTSFSTGFAELDISRL